MLKELQNIIPQPYVRTYERTKGIAELTVTPYERTKGIAEYNTITVRANLVREL